MTRTVRARVTHGVLAPLEPLDLLEGSEVDVTVSTDQPTAEAVAAFRRAAGGWKGTVDAEKVIENIYASRRLQTRPVPRL